MDSPSFRKTLCDKYQRALDLSEVESKKDPDSAPFRSKYSARELLKEMKSLLGPWEGGEEPQDPPDTPARLETVLLAVVEHQLGVSYLETEEEALALEHLMKSMVMMERCRLSQECVSVYVQAQKNLGILWAGTDDDEAKAYLESAESVYLQYMAQIGKPPLELHEHFLAKEEQFTEQERFKSFEKVYVHTLHYLVQVYEHMELFDKMVQCLHTSLQHQLEYTDYNPAEWARNAATLSQYYLPKGWYIETRHCLAAANVILSQAGHVVPWESTEGTQQASPELLAQRTSEIARCWIKYCLNLLQDARTLLEDDAEKLDPDKQCALKAEMKKEEDEGERRKAALFGSSDIYDSILAAEEQVPCTYPLDFEEARRLFLVGQHYVSEAKQYFQLDAHYTDHIEILLDHSALFQVLAFFEKDCERRCKMHKRRLDMLEPLYKELDPEYDLLMRKLQFDLGDTYYEMMDLKVAIGSKLEQLDCRTIKKINSLALSAIKYYSMFLGSVKSTPGQTCPDVLEEDDVRPAMYASFQIGQLYDQLITADEWKQLENMQIALEYYSFLVNSCEKNEDAFKTLGTELQLSKAMTGLILPVKIEKLRAKLLSK